MIEQPRREMRGGGNRVATSPSRAEASESSDEACRTQFCTSVLRIAKLLSPSWSPTFWMASPTHARSKPGEREKAASDALMPQPILASLGARSRWRQ